MKFIWRNRIASLALLTFFATSFLLALRVEAKLRAVRCLGLSTQPANNSPNSRACLGCHDGVSASNVRVTDAQSKSRGLTGDHPVLISYAQAYRRNPEELVAPNLIDSRLKLEGGQIGCLTCHSAASQERSFLTLPDTANGLCVSCHKK